MPAEIDAAITQDYLAFVDIAELCIGDTAASDDGLMLAGCTTGACPPKLAHVPLVLLWLALFWQKPASKRHQTAA